MTSISRAPAACIVIFGASGNLAERKLAPALHSLACAGHLDPATRVLGVGRTPLSDRVFRERLYRGVEIYARLKPNPKLCSLWSRFEGRFSYLSLPTDVPSAYERLADHLEKTGMLADAGGNALFYLATPPDAVESIVAGLAASGLSGDAEGWRRLVAEKPFGEDLRSARRLNELIHSAFAEDQIFRIDHYLGKETVQNILVVRFVNGIFDSLWRRDHVDHVQITAAETVGIVHRAATYDRIGVLRDIVQNHLLQLVALTAAEPPATPTADGLRDAKLDVLSAVRPIASEDLILGQYKGYADVPGVSPGSRTPTFAALRLWIDTPRWRGVPFYLRTGKRLTRKSTEITLQFLSTQAAPLGGFPQTEPNRISLRLQPEEGIQLRFRTKVPGAGMTTEPVDMTFRYADHYGTRALPDAYERLLLDALQGDPSLFIRNDEIETCWAMLEPALRCETETVPFGYDPGAWGPPEADRLFSGTDRRWLCGCAEARS